MKRVKWGIAAMLAVLLVVLAGCQSIGGVDVTKALTDTLSVKSSESKQTVSLKLVPTDGKLSEEDQKVFDILNSLSLTIDHAMMQDASTVSMEGSIELQGKKLPFELSMDKENMLVTLEGMKQPIAIPLNSAEDIPALSEMMLSNENIMKVAQDIYGFMFKHMPNPSTISVTPVSEKVNGESLSLKKLHVEIHGDELVGLIKGFLTSVSKDKEGLKEVIGAVYDVYAPVISAVAGGLHVDTEDGADAQEDLPKEFNFLKDKEAAVLYATNEMQKALDELLPQYDDSVKGLLKETPELNDVLGKNTILSLDFMLDNQLNVRKQNMDLTVQLPQMKGVPVKQIVLQSEAENWNINQPVTAKKVDTSQGIWDVDKDGSTPGAVLRHIDPNSELYRMLKDDMNITRKNVTMRMDDEAWYAIDYQPRLVNGTLMVPVKYVANELDADLKWDGATKQMTLTDDLTGAKIVLKIGSNEATVNGVTETLPQPVQNFGGNAYAPLRFITKALGAEGNWDAKEQVVTIERN